MCQVTEHTKGYLFYVPKSGTATYKSQSGEAYSQSSRSKFVRNPRARLVVLRAEMVQGALSMRMRERQDSETLYPSLLCRNPDCEIQVSASSGNFEIGRGFPKATFLYITDFTRMTMNQNSTVTYHTLPSYLFTL